ncbi:MAG TPA: hypothetical protein VHC69_36085 [Polyangiaceae bacterium]|nr:hypothetical protein [Polyangiaceae bacterium]
MRPLFTLSARWVLLSCGLVFSVALLGALVRLLPWLVAKEVPLGTSMVFAEALVASGAEVALLVGFPVGAAIAAARWVERGEARALAALGARPLRLGAALVPIAIAGVVASMGVTRSSESTAAAQLMGRLVRSARLACSREGAPQRVDVPLVSSSWLCFATGPRIVGAVPGLAAGLWFTGGDLRVAADERALVIDDLHIAGAGISMRAASARISGLPGWPRARRLGGLLRGALTGSIAAATALAAVWAVLRANISWPVAAAAASGAAALGTVALVKALDDVQAGVGAYWLAVPSGALLALLLHCAVQPIARSRIAWRKA